ncbi:MAG: DUF192 domain-containing protein [Tepidiformaceae bacterium]
MSAELQTVRNTTTGTVIGDQIRFAGSVASRTRGLMMAAPLKPGQGLVIRPCTSIHMMWMRFSLDAVFYDRDGRVTKVARHVRPWIGISFGGKGAKGVIELPVGAAAGTEVGHQLEFSGRY